MSSLKNEEAALIGALLDESPFQEPIMRPTSAPASLHPPGMGGGVEGEDPYLSTPAYHDYYYAARQSNPRLPPPTTGAQSSWASRLHQPVANPPPGLSRGPPPGAWGPAPSLMPQPQAVGYGGGGAGAGAGEGFWREQQQLVMQPQGGMMAVPSQGLGQVSYSAFPVGDVSAPGATWFSGVSTMHQPQAQHAWGPPPARQLPPLHKRGAPPASAPTTHDQKPQQHQQHQNSRGRNSSGKQRNSRNARNSRSGRKGDSGKPRSDLLEDFRSSNRRRIWTLADISGHIAEFCEDQHGSRFIQQQLEITDASGREAVFVEIRPQARQLIEDVFGNYCVQKFFESGTPEQIAELVTHLHGNVVCLARQMYGCRVIQKAIEVVDRDEQARLVAELRGNVMTCATDQNANHVLQKCVECVESPLVQFIVDDLKGHVVSLAMHPYGCRVVQRVLEFAAPSQRNPIMAELLDATPELVRDNYANYCIQHVLKMGSAAERSSVLAHMRTRVLLWSRHKFASNVVESCVLHASEAERQWIVDEVLRTPPDASESTLALMAKDKFANYVVQKLMDVVSAPLRKQLVDHLTPLLPQLRKINYSKHIVSKVTGEPPAGGGGGGGGGSGRKRGNRR